MTPSAAFCRTQAAFQRNRAATASLENVRLIAVKAEAAWTVEGELAEARERRRARVATELAVPDDDEFDGGPSDHDLLVQGMSENPDREAASTPSVGRMAG